MFWQIVKYGKTVVETTAKVVRFVADVIYIKEALTGGSAPAKQ